MFSSFGAFTEPQQQPIKKTTKIFNHTLLQFRTFLSPRVLDYRRGNCEINSKEERMKIQCNVCESAEATVLCCADEAALCHNCDEKVHAANKLASKHQRVSISHSSSQIPKCDICQDAAGYFFCLEDRALLCRKCDIAIHTANAFVSSHQRFLLTGVKVGLEAAAPGSSSSGGISHSAEKVSDAENQGTLKRSAPASTTSQHERESSIQRRVDVSMPSKRSLSKPVAHEFPKMQPAHGGAFEDITQTRMAIAGGSAAGTLSQWPIDDFLALNDFHLNYGFHDNGSSKADSGKLGESDSSLFMRSIEDDLDSDDRLGQVPDVSWTVPQVPSPPTASGLYWPKATQHLVDNAVFVPDICWNQASSYHQ